MIISTFDPGVLHSTLGIDMSTVDLGSTDTAGAGWARVAPGTKGTAHQHDETETFVIVAGHGEVVVGEDRRPVAPGTVIVFEPFETHVIENTGAEDLVFVTFYWRDAARAARAAAGNGARRLDGRPVFVFSTPPTPNGDLHLGHLSGPYLGADAYVRFQRMNGVTAWHLTGSDDFQSYVVEAARREGRSPEETAAHYSGEIAATLALMDIVPDQYTVTSRDEGYAEGLQDFFSRLVASGGVTPQEHPALFDAETDAYLYEVDVRGTCPACGNPAGGNICEDCGEPNSCADLVDPSSGRSAEPPRLGTHTRYTLPLHDFRAELADHHRLGRVPLRLRDLADRLLRRDRVDVSITHPATWGVPPVERLDDEQVIWVWPEMAYGFLHGIQSLGDRRADEPRADWKIVHFFGYDNSFYHAILYPVLYRLAHPEWTPDIDYHVNEFYLLEGQKFSTSRRHAIWGKEVLGPRSVDAVRFFLSSTRPEGRRTNFAMSEYDRVRRMLADTWQGWLHDLGDRIAKNHDGVAPDAGVWTLEHTAFLDRLGNHLAALTTALGPDGFSLNQAAAELHRIVEDTVRFQRIGSMNGSWADEGRTAIALELAAARLLAHGAAPVMPRFADKLAAALGMSAPEVWPDTVTLLPPGSEVALSGQEFFSAGAR